MSTRKPLPLIAPIPGEIVAEAAEMGLFVETHHEVIAGHGHTGRIAWSVFVPRETSPGFTESIRLRYGADLTHERTRASLRDALAEIRAQRLVIEIPGGAL